MDFKQTNVTKFRINILVSILRDIFSIFFPLNDTCYKLQEDLGKNYKCKFI